jgi:15-cis-phytoene synthase
MASDAVMAAARSGEPDRFVAALLAPADVRDDLLAVAGFCAELRRIPESVTEPMMGEVRLQWWRDTIAAGPATTGHPIADGLGTAIARHRLPIEVFDAMTEAHAFDLYDDPMHDRAAFQGYLEKTEGLAFDLTHRILTGRAAAREDVVAASSSYGIARLLAELPRRLAQRGRHPLPFSITSARDGDIDATGRDLFAELMRHARDSHATLRRSVGRMTRRDRIAFLPTATVPSYLRRISPTSLAHAVDLDPTRRMARIAWAHLTGL